MSLYSYMTIQTTIWRPAFCDCVIYYTWDDTVPEASRTHIPHDNTKKCNKHSALPDKESNYSTVLDECIQYFDAKTEIIDNSPATFYDIDINNKKILKSGIEIMVSYSGVYPNRILNLSYSGVTLTTNQRNSIQNKLNTRFGTGRIVLL